MARSTPTFVPATPLVLARARASTPLARPGRSIAVRAPPARAAFFACADPEPAAAAAAAPEAVAEAAAPAGDAAPAVEAAPAADAAPAAEAGGDEKKSAKRVAGGRRGGGRAKKEITLKLEDMAVGMEIEGVVKSTTTYGAFVGDMGTATDGLLHVSELASGFVENVTDIVSVGDKITVRVLSVDVEKGNFSLSMRSKEEIESPSAKKGGGGGGGGGGGNNKWAAFKFDPTTFVDVKVVSVAGFGAFCKILDKDGNEDDAVPTDGLIHISEMSEDHVTDVASILSVGQTTKARVTATDKKRNRISLSLKKWAAGEAETLAEDMEASKKGQPEFRTIMELAFERAKAKSNK